MSNEENEAPETEAQATITLYSVTTNAVRSQLRGLGSGVWKRTQVLRLLDSPPYVVEVWKLQDSPRYFVAPMRTAVSDSPLTETITIP